MTPLHYRADAHLELCAFALPPLADMWLLNECVPSIVQLSPSIPS